MVTHDRDLTSRMSWFDRQFLRAQDFADEQDYQLDRRHRHNRLLHTAGVADGLGVTGDPGGNIFALAAGTALDVAGREIVLLESATHSVPDSLSAATAAEVYVLYEEEAIAPSQDPGVTGQATRTREAVRVGVREVAPQQTPVPTSQTPGPLGTSGQIPGVLVARLELKDGKLRATPANGVRHRAGAEVGEVAMYKMLLRRADRPESEWPELSAGDANQAVVTGGLRVTGRVALNGGATLGANTDFVGNDRDVLFRGPGDANHGVGWYGAGKLFEGGNVNGPVLYGDTGGALGTTNGGQKRVVEWHKDEVIAQATARLTRGAYLHDQELRLRGGADANHGVGWYGPTKTFAGAAPDGPVLYGNAGGALGTTAGGQKQLLTWKSSGEVGVPGRLFLGTGNRELRVLQSGSVGWDFQLKPQGPNLTVTRHVTFNPPYAVPPAVYVAQKDIDFDASRNLRLGLTATNISTTGFDLVFNSWADTIIFAVSASWIAH